MVSRLPFETERASFVIGNKKSQRGRKNVLKAEISLLPRTLFTTSARRLSMREGHHLG